MISNMSVFSCNRFCAIRANSGNITSFKGGGYPSFRLSFKENPFIHMHEILSQKTTVLGPTHSKDFVILACTVLIGLKSVTDGQTD